MSADAVYKLDYRDVLDDHREHGAEVTLVTTELPLEEAGRQDFGHELLPQLVDRGKAFARELGSYWKDVGTIESYWQAHMDLLEPEPALALDDASWPILTLASQRPPARVEAPARIESSLISPGCTVRGRVVRSVLAPGIVVEEGAEVVDAIVDTAAEIETDVSGADEIVVAG